MDIADFVFWIDEVIAGIDIFVCFYYEVVTAGLTEDTQARWIAKLLRQ
ncbi:hypothetical protein JCM19231_1842 [Vibrio ishigakensis]|uniref:Uncharacterized protein n=1 Tax=Vibrio ishigakensis TaxID=1481914 RepID=A0A0B8P0B5_9VIBR|nr:hypothetical protein JCM19231_1842 [Vibrio ishigakensis]